MAKTRLNERHRDMLIRFAKETIECPAEQKEMDAAYTAAAKAVRGAVQRSFPTRDMNILKKYGVADADFCIGCADLDTARVFRFNFRKDDAAPLAPSKYCSTRSIGLEADETALTDAYFASESAHEAAFAAKFRDYLALIRGSRHLEDILDVWPACAPIAEKISAGATAVISTEVIDRIKADQAT